MGIVGKGSLVVAALLLPAQALAQSDATRAAARDLGSEGVEDFQAGNYAAASTKLEKAFNILRAPSLGLWSARALAKTGKLVEASERYLAVTRLDATKGDRAVQKKAQADAVAERDALQPRIPALTLEVTGAGGEVAVTLDGAPIEAALFGVRQPANPGKHVGEARQGSRVVRGEVTLNEGQRLSLTLDFAHATLASGAGAAAPPASAPPSSAAPSAPAPAPRVTPAETSGAPVPVGVWVGAGLAGAGVLAGGISAGLAAKKKSDLSCPNDRCTAAQRDDVSSYNGLRTVSTIGFVTAGVGAAVAGVFWFTRPHGTEQAYVSPYIGLGAAGVAGAF
jgi:hypothetical protein